jgi:large subunit ribosomal protein L18
MVTKKKIFTMPFRRKMQGKTDYKKRLGLLKSRKLRLVVRRSNKNMVAQLVKYGDEGDVMVHNLTTKHLAKFGWQMNSGNIPSAYLLGLLLGKTAKDQEAILDLGLQTPISGSRVYAVLKGAIDGGLKIAFSEESLPTDERISGKHISTYANSIKENYDKYFSGYVKNSKDPKKFEEEFEKVKKNILSMV